MVSTHLRRHTNKSYIPESKSVKFVPLNHQKQTWGLKFNTRTKGLGKSLMQKRANSLPDVNGPTEGVFHPLKLPISHGKFGPFKRANSLRRYLCMRKCQFAWMKFTTPTCNSGTPQKTNMSPDMNSWKMHFLLE